MNQLRLFAQPERRYLLPYGTPQRSSGGLPAHIDDNGQALCGAVVGEHEVNEWLCSWDLCKTCEDLSN